MKPSFIVLVGIFGSVVACGRARESESKTSIAPVPSTTPAALHLGEPISGAVVALSDIASHQADYKGKTITTTGTVTAVCQEMGCWMEIKDADGAAHIRMHGHSFFVPKTASGHHAKVQATIVPAKGGEEDCNEEAAKQMGHPVAKIELDATGIELD